MIVAAYGNRHQIKFSNFIFKNEDMKTYAKAMMLDSVLNNNGIDNYALVRKNVGVNYSPITSLSDPALTDKATSQIESCLREHIKNPKGLKDFSAIVGELHDNVWSHGKSTGYSMAQKSKVPNEDDSYIEFALADMGCGLKSEMEFSGNRVLSHQEAIKWCVQEGNSTKLRKIDDWAQRVPDDLIGPNPYGQNITTFDKDNHHQGLGLAKLVKLVRQYSAAMQLASGDCLYKIAPDGSESYVSLNREWQGVAISCQLRLSKLLSAESSTESDPELDYIIKGLKAEDL